MSTLEKPSIEKTPRRKPRFWPILLLVVIASGGILAWNTLPWRSTISTDDAFLEGHIIQISPRVDGRILKVHISENQMVQAGERLAEIDPRDFQVRVTQAQAALSLAQAKLQAALTNVELTRTTTSAAVDQAKAEVLEAQSKVAQAQSEVIAAEAEAKRATADRARYEKLDDLSVSKQQKDVVRKTADAAEAELEAARKFIAVAEAGVSAAKGKLAAANAAPFQVAVSRTEVNRNQAEIAQAQAVLDEAELELSYTQITAPEAGIITRKSVEPGNYVKTGQQLMAIVPTEMWVVANFKETQLKELRVGQPVRIYIDAYPNRVFNGHVQSLQSGSGARFSLLPPENATGNYVKVVQRVPVKITFDEQPDPEHYHLGPGMSVVPEVMVR